MENSYINTPPLETGRLILRKFDLDDLPALLGIYSDQEANTFLPWLPLTSLEEAQAFFEKWYERIYEQHRGYRYAICLKTDNVPIGYVNLSLEDCYDLGFGLRNQYWHQGITTEACQAVIEQVKQDGIPYITATHDVNNPRSGNVMKKIGMVYQYSYKEQWQPKDFLVTFRMYQLNFDTNDGFVYKKYWNQSTVHFIESDV